MAVIDEHGFRLNVGIVLANAQGCLFWGRRLNQEAWQFPQGGLLPQESLESALYRELQEEVGLLPQDVSLVAESQVWLTYLLPKRLVRLETYPMCIGQRQKWFLLKLIKPDKRIDLMASPEPEFDQWRWVNYWYPLQQIVNFKREVYRQVLLEFAPILNNLPPSRLRLDPLNRK